MNSDCVPGRITALLQARTSSTRLPGKVLLPVLGVPMILRQVERIQRSSVIDRLIVVTSTDDSDEELALLCSRNNIDCFRGSLNDVLDRYYQAAKQDSSQHLVRLTADCPLTDPELIDQVIQYYAEGEFDYVSNAIEPTFPDGLDVEVFRFSCLEEAWKEARLPSQREHVTPFIYRQPEKFKIGHFKARNDLSHFRWTVDEPEDFILIERIYAALYASNPEFTTRDVLKLLVEKPELQVLNQAIMRNEGMLESLKQDRTVEAGQRSDTASGTKL